MPLLSSLAPSTPVNQGLAFVNKPMYPEIIGMLDNAKKSKAAQAKMAQEKLSNDLDWIDDQEFDSSKLDQDDATELNMGFEAVQAKAIKMARDGGSPRVDEDIRKGFSSLSSISQQMASNKATKTEYIGQMKKDGQFFYSDRAKVGGLFREEEDRARKARTSKALGKPFEGNTNPDYEGIMNNPESWNRNELYKKTFESMGENTTNVYRKLDNGESLSIEEREIINADIFKRDAKGVREFDRARGEYILKDEMSDASLRFITDNKEGAAYKAIQFDLEQSRANGEDITFNQQAMRSLVASGVGIQKQTDLTVKDSPSNKKGGLTPADEAKLKFTKSFSEAAANGDPKDINNHLATLSGMVEGVSYKFVNGKIEAEVSKIYLEKMGMDMSTMTNEDFGNLFDTKEKVVNTSSVTLTYPFGKKGYEKTMYKILNTTKHLNAQTRSGTMDIVGGQEQEDLIEIPGVEIPK